MKYPYQMLMVDTFRTGSLEQYTPGYPVEDPNRSSTVLLSDITLIARQKEFVALRTEDGCRGLLLYRTGILSKFASETELVGYLQDHCQVVVPLRWQDMDTEFREFEKMRKR